MMNDLGPIASVAQDDEMVPLERCDVSDSAVLMEFRKQRANWISWYEFRKDNPNNIEGQIIGMVFLDIAYRTLASGRGDFNKGPDIAARSGILAHMLDQGYVAIQVLAIRRLLDKRKDVSSLRRLFDDIRAKSQLITRENFVAYDGAPYDPNGWQQLQKDQMAQIERNLGPNLIPFARSTERHNVFDSLSGSGRWNRNRKDTIRPAVFDTLLSWLDCHEAQDLVKLSHKFFAHAADLNSREGLQYNGVLLSDIEAVQRAIVKAERAITDEILYIGDARDVVAMQPLGFLKGLDRVYVPPEAISEMNARWNGLREDRDSWKNAYKAELYK